ncbi:hypothetical protein [Pantoea sp. CFSAN033090]|nr:hypothetical protein [Pantoea sp. CFSAN033090]
MAGIDCFATSTCGSEGRIFTERIRKKTSKVEEKKLKLEYQK